MNTNVLKFLKGTGQVALQVAPEVASVYSPLMGSLLKSILKAQVTVGVGNGDKKKALVMDALPTIIEFTEAMLGRDLVNDEEFIKAIDKLVDDLVAVLNSINALPKAAPEK
jgi:hypothetical protein